eukprot:TRINITY_DN27009_c0_g2_i2.p1 TRINITY_DN27009_c0_g2~~TRINITY_DN27009_c0_g2_i2.p1  ORF type:complete len:429 (+),score=96.85 TRINITY_DN27009_c0_g2_i2:87-1373(+)
MHGYSHADDWNSPTLGFPSAIHPSVAGGNLPAWRTIKYDRMGNDRPPVTLSDNSLDGARESPRLLKEYLKSLKPPQEKLDLELKHAASSPAASLEVLNDALQASMPPLLELGCEIADWAAKSVVALSKYLPVPEPGPAGSPSGLGRAVRGATEGCGPLGNFAACGMPDSVPRPRRPACGWIDYDEQDGQAWRLAHAASSRAQRFEASRRRREDLLSELFSIHDLSNSGYLSEMDLIRLNEQIAILHYGADADLEAVRAKYAQLFRSKLDPEGRPAPLPKFCAYMMQSLEEYDPDPEAQEMILEQFIAEASLARTAILEAPTKIRLNPATCVGPKPPRPPSPKSSQLHGLFSESPGCPDGANIDARSRRPERPDDLAAWWPRDYGDDDVDRPRLNDALSAAPPGTGLRNLRSGAIAAAATRDIRNIRRI